MVAVTITLNDSRACSSVDGGTCRVNVGTVDHAVAVSSIGNRVLHYTANRRSQPDLAMASDEHGINAAKEPLIETLDC